MNSYKAVIFDFNGTLFFDNDKHVKAWGKISQLIRGHGISEEELHSHFNGVPNAKIIQYLLQGNGTEDQIEKYSCLKEEFYRILCKEDTPTFHLVDGANEYFDLLKKKNIPFTIASASIKDNIDFFVESFNLANWMNPNDIVYDDGTYENKIMMFKDAAKKANPIILEPMMKVTVIVPEEYMGDVIGDLNSRRGQIQGMEDRIGAKQINSRVPLSEMFGYVNDLRSKTQGRGQYTMEPDGYEPVPKSISEGIIADRAKKD